MPRYLVEWTSPVLVSVEVDADTEIDALLAGVEIFRADVSMDDLRARPIEQATKRYKQLLG